MQALRDKGFTHIRLLLDKRRLAGTGRARPISIEMFEQIILLLSLDYAVSLDLHPDGTVGQMFERDPREAERYLVGLWRAIANRVRSLDPAKVAVELLNEPQTDTETWQASAGRLIDRNQPHPAVDTPSSSVRRVRSGTRRLSGMAPSPTDNIVYAVHYYDPFAFTHQGADWGGADDPIRYLSDLPFPADAVGSR